jgi:hypothetical protein
MIFKVDESLPYPRERADGNLHTGKTPQAGTREDIARFPPSSACSQQDLSEIASEKDDRGIPVFILQGRYEGIKHPIESNKGGWRKIELYARHAPHPLNRVFGSLPAFPGKLFRRWFRRRNFKRHFRDSLRALQRETSHRLPSRHVETRTASGQEGRIGINNNCRSVNRKINPGMTNNMPFLLCLNILTLSRRSYNIIFRFATGSRDSSPTR